MLAATVRSGLVESTHPWSAVVADAGGHVRERWGEIDRPLFHRSAIKPFQATVCLETGVDLPPEHLAVATSSHSATPAHVALVRDMLHDGGLDESALGCPAAWPRSSRTRNRVVRAGDQARPVYHNCSGKHAAFLRACVAAGWPVESYLDPDHPLQRAVATVVAEVTGEDVHPTGVDGCGAPTLRGTLRGLATGFARLTVSPRFAAVATAMTRYPALTCGNDRPEGRTAMWWDGPAKSGAEGLMVASRHGLAIATKSHEGSIPIAVTGLLEVAARTGLLPATAQEVLADAHGPDVLGGDRPVGSVVADLDRWQTRVDP